MRTNLTNYAQLERVAQSLINERFVHLDLGRSRPSPQKKFYLQTVTVQQGHRQNLFASIRQAHEHDGGVSLIQSDGVVLHIPCSHIVKSRLYEGPLVGLMHPVPPRW